MKLSGLHEDHTRDARRANLGVQQGHEMQSYPQSSQSLPLQDFLNRLGELRNQIRAVDESVQRINQLHQRALADSDGGRANQELERVKAEASARNQAIRDELKALATDAHNTTDGTKSSKDLQIGNIKKEFERTLQQYQKEEAAYSQRYRDQIARQYRIVKPEADEQEVQQAANEDWGNEGVFQAAVCSVIGNTCC
jgi:syntaxin 1B/2/3